MELEKSFSIALRLGRFLQIARLICPGILPTYNEGV